MGKLARLNAAKGGTGTTWWIAVTKTDFSYDVKEEVDGVMVERHVKSIFYIPIGTLTGQVLPFKSSDEGKAWLKTIVDGILEPKDLERFYALDVRLLEVKYAPEKRKRYDHNWAEANVKQELEVKLRDLRSSEIK